MAISRLCEEILTLHLACYLAGPRAIFVPSFIWFCLRVAEYRIPVKLADNDAVDKDNNSTKNRSDRLFIVYIELVIVLHDFWGRLTAFWKP